jgi:hypothetical protein
MPLEGHWERQQTPLRRTSLRENRLVAIITSLTVIVVLGVVVLAIGLGSPSVGRGCLQITAAGTTGAFVLHPCGADAVSLCRQQALRSDALARRAQAACRQARIAGF